MKPSEISAESRFNESTFRLVSTLLVALMLTCASLTLLSLINRLVPSWQPWYLAVLCFFAALDRLYTHRRTSKLLLFSREWAITVATQWIVIFVVVKASVGLSHGLAAFLAEIPRWRSDFLDYFLNPETLFFLGVVIVTRLLSGAFAELLEELGLDQAIVLRDFPALQFEKSPARERLLSLIFSTGSVLVVFTALVRVDIRALFQNTSQLIFAELPALAGGGASTLLYFMLALALLSQTQFMDLHTRWSLQRVHVQRALAGRWALYSLLFLALLAALVSLLPTSYSLGLLSVLGYILNLISSFLYLIIQILLTVLVFLLSLPFLLFGRKSPLENLPGLAPRLPQPAPAADAAAIPVWWEVAKSLAFWAVLIVVLAFSIAQYLRQHAEILQRLRKLPGWGFLAQIGRWIHGMFVSVQTNISKVVEAGRERMRARQQKTKNIFGGGFLNLRKLDPRQKVYFFYLAFIRRSGESGLTRKLSQTPDEYAATLEDSLPDSGEDIDALTQTFIEARYSPHPVEPQKANLVKSAWERLRKALPRRKTP